MPAAAATTSALAAIADQIAGRRHHVRGTTHTVGIVVTTGTGAGRRATGVITATIDGGDQYQESKPPFTTGGGFLDPKPYTSP